MKNLKRNFWPLFSIVIVVALFFYKVVFFRQVPLPGDFIVGVYYPWLDYKWGTTTGVVVKNPITTDVVSFTYPMQTLAMNLLKNKVWPLWNPYILTGTTLLANFQSSPFAPTRVVYFLFDQITAWSWDVILQFILAATFAYFLLKWWKLSKAVSVFGGIAYAFSGYNLIFSEWNGHTLAAAFIPLSLLFADRLLKNRKYWDGVFLSITLALQFLSGYTQTSVYTAIAIGMLWIIRIYREKEWLTKTILLSIFCLIGVFLSSVQILPSLELMNNSQRLFEPHPYEWTFLPWKKTITFIAPDFFGNHSTGNYWGPQDYTSNTGYVGVVASVLGLFALVKLRKEKKEIIFLGSIAFIALLLSFPDPVSIFIWKNNVLGMQANSAYRATQLFCFAVIALAAFGLEELRKRKQKISDLIMSVVPLYVLLTVFALFAAFWFKNNVGLKNLILPGFILLMTTLVLFIGIRFKAARKFLITALFGLMVLEVFRFGWKFEPISPREYTYPTTPVLAFLQDQKKPFRTTGTKVIPSNLRMPYGIESVEGYDTFHPLNASEFIAAINSGNTTSIPVGRYGIVDNDTSVLLDLANTKYYLALVGDEKRFTSDPKRFVKIFNDKSVDVFESRSVLPRAFMVYGWEVVPKLQNNDLTALNKILAKNYPLGKKVILEDNPTIIQVEEKKTGKTNIKNKVDYIEYGNQESLISVESENDGLLFVSDAYYPGWKAFVDGKETKILKADFAFRAVEVTAGKHMVRMVYQPESFYLGLKVSLITFMVLIGGGILIIGKKKLHDYT